MELAIPILPADDLRAVRAFYVEPRRDESWGHKYHGPGPCPAYYPGAARKRRTTKRVARPRRTR
jgi:hypothetical protein